MYNKQGTTSVGISSCSPLVKVSGTEVRANAETEAARSVIIHAGKMVAEGSIFYADATSADSVGIENNAELIFNSGNVTGTHSGLYTGQNSKTYITGGTFSSCSYGGIYFGHGPNGEAYIENATIECKECTGNHTHNMYGGFFIDSTTATSAYLNNCTIRGGDNAFVLGNSNKVYISNSNIGNNTIMITDNLSKLFIGKGCNFNASNTDRESSVTITEDVYVKNEN